MKTEPYKIDFVDDSVDGSIVEFTGMEPSIYGTMSNYVVAKLIVYLNQEEAIQIKRCILIAAASVLLSACSASTNAEELTKSIEIEAICEIVETMDFTINQPELNISLEEDIFYKEAYLKILKSEIPTINSEGKTEYFKELYKAGVEFDELNEFYSYYYNDLDKDGFPELGVKSTGYTYILKYMPQENEFTVLFCGPTMYYTILGVRQLGYHDGTHAGVIRDQYIILNDKNEWEAVLDLQQGTQNPVFYEVGTTDLDKVDVGKENWNKIAAPYFKAIEQSISSKTLEEIFGELL